MRRTLRSTDAEPVGGPALDAAVIRSSSSCAGGDRLRELARRRRRSRPRTASERLAGRSHWYSRNSAVLRAAAGPRGRRQRDQLQGSASVRGRVVAAARTRRCARTCERHLARRRHALDLELAERPLARARSRRRGRRPRRSASRAASRSTAGSRAVLDDACRRGRPGRAPAGSASTMPGRREEVALRVLGVDAGSRSRARDAARARSARAARPPRRATARGRCRSPCTSSVTGCSTCSRAFSSMK